MGNVVPKKKKMILKKQQQPATNNVVASVSNQTESDDVAMVEKHLEARNSISMPSFTLQEIFEDVEDI